MLWYLLVRFALCGLQALPLEAALRMSRALSRLASRVDRPHHRRAMEHIRLAYPDALDNRQVEAMAHGVFETIVRHVCQVIHMVRRRRLLLPTLQGADTLLNAYALGRGVVIVTAHLGPFGLFNLIPRHLNLRTVVVLKRQKNRRLLGWVSRVLLDQLGVEMVLKPDAPKLIPEFLRRGYLIILFADQRPSGGGFSDTFLSRPAMVAAGPTIFAKRYKAPIVVASITTDARGRNVARFEGPVSAEGSLEEVTRRWNRILEERIREHPEQWAWMHRRWRDKSASAPLPEPAAIA